MKKILVLLLSISLIFLSTGCNNLDNYEQWPTNELDMRNLTYDFSGKSKNFIFEVGKVYFSDEERGLEIKNFKQTNKINEVTSITFTVYFNDVLWASQTNKNNLNKINKIIPNTGFYEFGEVYDENSGGYEGSSFDFSNKDNFKDIIKVEAKYCIKENCTIELFKIDFQEVE